MQLAEVEIDDLFRGPLFPTNWERVLERIKQSEPDASVLLVWRTARETLSGPVSLGHGPQSRLMRAKADGILNAAIERQVDGSPLTGLFRVDLDNGAELHCQALDLSCGHTASLVVGRPTSPWMSSELSDQLVSQSRTLRRALEAVITYRQAVQTSLQSAALTEAIGDAALLIDEECQVIATNAKAQQLLAHSTTIGLTRSGHVRLATVEKTRQLTRLVAAAAVDAAAGPAALRLSEASHKAGLWIVVARLPNDPKSSGAGPIDNDRQRSSRLLITLKSIADQDVVSVAALQRCFDLTSREAELVAALAAGESIKEYALVTGRSENTVRWHLANVLQKMGCRNQTDVVRLVLRLLVT